MKENTAQPQSGAPDFSWEKERSSTPWKEALPKFTFYKCRYHHRLYHTQGVHLTLHPEVSEVLYALLLSEMVEPKLLSHKLTVLSGKFRFTFFKSDFPPFTTIQPRVCVELCGMDLYHGPAFLAARIQSLRAVRASIISVVLANLFSDARICNNIESGISYRRIFDGPSPVTCCAYLLSLKVWLFCTALFVFIRRSISIRWWNCILRLIWLPRAIFILPSAWSPQCICIWHFVFHLSSIFISRARIRRHAI